MRTDSSEPRRAAPDLLVGMWAMAKQGGVLAMGHIGAQALLLLASPVLTRLFTPADLGTFGIVVAIVAVPAAIANANFDQTIVLPRSERTAAHLAALASMAVLILALLVFGFGSVAHRWLESRGLGDIVWFGAAWLVGYGLFRVFDQWAIRGERFGQSAVAHTVRTATMVVVQCVGGVFAASSTTLLAGQLIGQWIGTCFLIRGFRRWLSVGWMRQDRLRALIRKYRAFPMFGSPQVIVNDLAINAPVFLFGILLGPAAAGQYWLAFRAIIMPSSLFERSFRAAFYRRIAAKSQNHEGFFGDVFLVTVILGFAGLLPTIFIVAFGPQIFDFVFGGDWKMAGEYARWLVVWWLFGVINLPSVAAIPILGLQRAFLIYEICYAGARLGALALGALIGPIEAVAAFTITAVIFNFSLVAYVHRTLWMNGSTSAVQVRRPDVAFFLPSLAGNGAERVVLLIAKELARRGALVELVAARAVGELVSKIPPGVQLVDLGASRMLVALPLLVGYLRHVRPAVLMPTITVANVVALIARALAHVPTKVIIRQAAHLRATRTMSNNAKTRAIAWVAEQIYRLSDGAVAISTGVADDLIRHAKMKPGQVSVIYNPIDVQAVQRVASEVAPHPWLMDQVPVVLGVGRLTRQKDFATLLQAFAALRAFRPARLIVLGEGEDRRTLESLAVQLGVAADVAFPGYVENPCAYMSKASVLVLSSRWEGFGNVLVEALACGLPVVSTDCPSGPREILQDGQFGTLVEVGDSNAMAEAIARELDAPPAPERQRMRATDFAVSGIAAEYATVLDIRVIQH